MEYKILKIQAAGSKEHQCGIIGDHDDPVDDTVCGEKETPEKKKVADIEQGGSGRNENSRNSMDGEATDRTDAHQDQGSDINSEEGHLFSDRLPPSVKDIHGSRAQEQQADQMNGGNVRLPQEKGYRTDVPGKEKAGTQHKLEFQAIIGDSIEQQRCRTDPACRLQPYGGDECRKKRTKRPERFIGSSQMKPEAFLVIKKKGKTDSEADDTKARDPDQGTGTSFNFISSNSSSATFCVRVHQSPNVLNSGSGVAVSSAGGGVSAAGAGSAHGSGAAGETDSDEVSWETEGVDSAGVSGLIPSGNHADFTVKRTTASKAQIRTSVMILIR